MRSAGKHAQWAGSRLLHSNGFKRIPSGSAIEGAASLEAKIQPALCRRVHHPQHRLLATNQRDVHGEFLAAANELPGPVQGIDQPVPPPARA